MPDRPDCPTPRECSLLQSVLGARCDCVPPIDPTIAERIKPKHKKMPSVRDYRARGLSDAKRARDALGYNKSERPTS